MKTYIKPRVRVKNVDAENLCGIIIGSNGDGKTFDDNHPAPIDNGNTGNGSDAAAKSLFDTAFDVSDEQ